MAESSAKRCAVVTGAIKGIGYAICKELASRGISVILTARDETRGREAVNSLGMVVSDSVVFHQLDVTDPDSVATLTEFVMNRFGKLDSLVNNAGVGGAILDADAMRFAAIGKGKIDWSKVATEPYELAQVCLEINYYGVKRMVESCLHLLQLSDSPRIVNLSSSITKLKLPEGWARQVLSNVEALTEVKVDEVVEEFLKDFKEGLLEGKGWPVGLSAYHVSKVALNAYTKVLATKLPVGFCVNCVCPGFVKTDLSCHTGPFTPEEGAKGPVRLAMLPEGGPSGRFFVMINEESFD